jgi:DNA gyrase/topoisomerase IV subunit A
VFPVAEVGVLKAAGKGVTGIDLRDGDAVLAFELARDAVSGPRVVTMNGRAIDVTEKEFGMGARGNRGNVVLKRGSIDTWSRAPVVTAIPEPSLPPTEA